MLTPLDNLLRALLTRDVAALRPLLADTQQVGFQPPDDEWVGVVKKMQRNALNVYLVDLRENRKLRSNERAPGIENGRAVDIPAPARMDCHYLITAWSPSERLVPTVEPTFDEHTLLYQAAAALFNAAPLNPARVYAATPSESQKWPEGFRDVDLPLVVAPPEGFPKLAEFWGAMGAGQRWRPALYVVITVPVKLLSEPAAPPVTTLVSTYTPGQGGDVLIPIGGTVYGQPDHGLRGVWVALETNAGERLQVTETDAAGRFRFEALAYGRYLLRVRAGGYHEAMLPIEVPSVTGSYDVALSEAP